MIERTIQLRREGGEMETFIAHPSAGGPFPAVMLYMDMWGMRTAVTDIARRIAAAGYYCVLPDLYYRGGKVRYAAHDDAGKGLSFTDLDPERQIALRAAMNKLSDAMVIWDTAFLLQFMTQGEPVRPGPFGAVGYCMGGRHALCAAGTFPDRFRAAACLHGTDLVKDGETSPHLLARRAAGEIYCGHAGRDRYARPDVVQRLDEALAGCSVRYQRRVHADAQHSYAMPDRDVFDQDATDQDWREISAMLIRQLRPEAL
ncbi:MAG TPA: dienelactone hydrolase family protein [Alphaproteobacteria bacterium]